MKIIENLFYLIGKWQALKVEKALRKDPEYIELQREINKIKLEQQRLKNKYKDDEFFKNML